MLLLPITTLKLAGQLTIKSCLKLLNHLSIETRPICINSYRNYTTANNDTIIKESKSKHIIYRKVVKSGAAGEKVSPLVVFFPWVDAKNEAVDKYCDLYHSLGWDVVTAAYNQFVIFY